MDAIIEQLIADFHARKLPELTQRQARLPWLPGKIDAVIGMRRSGKTCFLYQRISELLAAGRQKSSMLYVNFEDERLLPMRASDLRRIPDAYYRMYPSCRQEESAFFFDEIQNIEGWDRFLRRLLDMEQVHLCVTGSSARLLGREIATALRGRCLTTEIFPFHFVESLEHAGIERPREARPGGQLRSLLENRLRSFLLAGGFPEVQPLQEDHRVRVLQEYLDAVILRDLIERFRISNTIALRYLVRHLIHNPASPFSVNKFYHDLRSQGVPCGKDTLHGYLDYLTDAYLLFPVWVHTASERARMVNPRKLYVVDTGLARACSRKPQPDWGHLLENFVFLELRKRGVAPCYYRTESGREVDFFFPGHDGQSVLLQVAWQLQDKETRDRELSVLREAAREVGVNEATIVTLAAEEHIEANGCLINLTPAWLWASWPGAPRSPLLLDPGDQTPVAPVP